jgi:hypothetical protein
MFCDMIYCVFLVSLYTEIDELMNDDFLFRLDPHHKDKGRHLPSFSPISINLMFISPAMSPLIFISSLFLLVGATASVDIVGTEIGADDSNLYQQIKRHNEFVVLEGHKERENYHSPLPYTYISQDDLPVCVCVCVCVWCGRS